MASGNAPAAALAERNNNGTHVRPAPARASHARANAAEDDRPLAGTDTGHVMIVHHVRRVHGARPATGDNVQKLKTKQKKIKSKGARARTPRAPDRSANARGTD